MTLYLDTSTLVPLFFREPASIAVLARIETEEELWISRWTLAEFSSAAAFKLRRRETRAAIVSAALALLDAKIAAGGFRLAEVEHNDLDVAARLCRAHRSELRTPDALHVAIAARLRMPLLTCDKRQAAGCRYHAIDCEFLAVP